MTIRALRTIFAALGLLASAGTVLAAPGAAGHSHGHGGETAYGRPGDPKKPARVVKIAMGEKDGKMHFIPNRIEIRRGEQVRFQLRNNGEIDHELVVATLEENLKHAIEMQRTPTWSMTTPTPSASRRGRPARSSGISLGPASSTSPA